MSKQEYFSRKIEEETAKTEKISSEARLVKRVGYDLETYRKMIKIKKYD
jgi:hypothetical protein